MAIAVNIKCAAVGWINMSVCNKFTNIFNVVLAKLETNEVFVGILDLPRFSIQVIYPTERYLMID